MNRLLSAFVVTSIFLGFTTHLSAQTNQGILNNKSKNRITPTVTGSPSSTVTPTPDNRTTAEKCEAKKQQLLQKVDVFATTRDAHLHVYNSILTKLKDIQATLKTENKDTSVVDAQIVLLDDKMKVFTADVDDLIVHLKAAEQFDCSTGDINAFITDLQPFIDQVKADANELKQFYLTTIRPYMIRALAPGNGKKVGWNTNGKLSQ